jgi:hypothetical protein
MTEAASTTVIPSSSPGSSSTSSASNAEHHHHHHHPPLPHLPTPVLQLIEKRTHIKGSKINTHSTPNLAQPPAEEESLVYSKCILFGKPCSGKSTLVHRLTTGQYVPIEEATMGVSVSKFHCHVDSVPVPLQLWDTSGNERVCFLHPSQCFDLDCDT